MLLLQSKFPHCEWYLILSNLNTLFSLEQRHLVKHLQSYKCTPYVKYAFTTATVGYYNVVMDKTTTVNTWKDTNQAAPTMAILLLLHALQLVYHPSYVRLCKKCLPWMALRLWKKLYLLRIPHFNIVFPDIIVSLFCVCRL